jgi:urease accessory protein UreE
MVVRFFYRLLMTRRIYKARKISRKAQKERERERERERVRKPNGTEVALRMLGV